MAIHTIEGKLISNGLKFGVVAGRFNELITNKLVSDGDRASRYQVGKQRL